MRFFDFFRREGGRQAIASVSVVCCCVGAWIRCRLWKGRSTGVINVPGL